MKKLLLLILLISIMPLTSAFTIQTIHWEERINPLTITEGETATLFLDINSYETYVESQVVLIGASETKTIFYGEWSDEEAVSRQERITIPPSIYESAGTYTIAAIMHDRAGDDDTDELTLIVEEAQIDYEDFDVIFSMTPTIGDAPLSVTTNCNVYRIPNTGTTASYDIELILDDGSYGNENTNTHTYQNAGNYYPKCEVTQKETGLTEKKTKYVKVNEPQPINHAPVAIMQITENPSIVGKSVFFDARNSYDIDNDTLSYIWYIDGNAVSYYPTFSKTFYQERNHEIKLKAYDGELRSYDYETLIIQDYENFELDFSVNPTNGTAPLKINIICRENPDDIGVSTTYTQKVIIQDYKGFEDTIYNNPNFQYTLENPGEYSVKCYVTQTETGEQKYDREEVIVNEPIPENRAPIAKIELSKNKIYVGESITFDGSNSYDPDNDTLTHNWYYVQGVLITQEEIFTENFNIAGNYTITLRVNDGELSDSDTANFEVINKPLPRLNIETISCDNPIYVNTIQTCKVKATEKGSLTNNIKISLMKDLGDGVAGVLGTCYTAAGTCEVSFNETKLGTQTVFAIATKANTISDADGYPRFTYEVLQKPPVNHAPVASFTISKNPAYINETVRFDASASYDPDGDEISYKWTVNGFEMSRKEIFSMNFPYEDNYTIKLFVSDGELWDSETKIMQVISRPKQVLEIKELTCFDELTQGETQACSIKLSEWVEQVAISLYKTDREYVGECLTELNGGCVIRYTENDLGNHTVYAEARKTGYEADDDRYPRYHYEVIRKGFQITDLTIYEDPAYSIEENEFFRGEDLYVSFKVRDLQGNLVTDDIVTKTTLISLPGGRAELEEENMMNGKYYYKLNMIPLTHDFYGESQVFSFAFDFEEGISGQAEADLTIKNNPPMWMSNLKQRIRVGEVRTIFLNFLSSDLEEDILTYAATENSPYFSLEVQGNELIITGEAVGNGTVDLSATDYNDDSAYTTMYVNIYDFTPINEAPKAVINGTTTGVTNVEYVFDGSDSTDDKEIVNYLWYVDGDLEQSGTSTVFIRSFPTEAEYSLDLTVVDAEGLEDTASLDITITEVDDNENPVAILKVPNSTKVGEEITLDASESYDPDGSIVKYIWNIAGNVFETVESAITWVFNTAGNFDVRVDVVDNEGATAKDIKQVQVEKQKTPIVFDEPKEEAKDEDTLKFSNIGIYGHDVNKVRAGDLLQVKISAQGMDAEGRPSLIVPELGIKATGRIEEIDGREVLTAGLWIPKDTPEGEYMLRIGFKGDNTRKGEIRWFRVTE